MALLAYTIFASLLLVITVVVLSLVPGTDPDLGSRLGDPTSPLDVFLQLAFGALAIPAAWCGVRLGGFRPSSLLWSVEGVVRWDLVRRAALPVVLVLALVAALPLLSDGIHVPSGVGAGQLIGVIVVILVLGPLQALGMQMAFVGMAQQAVGTWLRAPIWAILIPVPFALIGRGLDAGAMVTAAVLMACCGFLAWKTGGLELPILLQLSVTVTTGIAAAFGGPANPSGPVASVGICAVTLVLATAISHSRGLSTWQPVERPGEGTVPLPVRV